jgi:hypothetical protein
MAGAAHNVEQEFWHPPLPAVAPVPERAIAATPVDACSRCETEFMVGSRFCHVCGTHRRGTESSFPGWTQYLEIQNIKERLGLSNASLVAFLLGVGCVFGALVVGFVFSAQTVLDWQAIQIWRIQWLLGSVVAFVAGILLKRSS